MDTNSPVHQHRCLTQRSFPARRVSACKSLQLTWSPRKNGDVASNSDPEMPIFYFLHERGRGGRGAPIPPVRTRLVGVGGATGERSDVHLWYSVSNDFRGVRWCAIPAIAWCTDERHSQGLRLKILEISESCTSTGVATLAVCVLPPHPPVRRD